MLAKNSLKYGLLLALSALLSALTILLGAIPMRASRLAFGRLPFWLGHAAVTAIFFALGFASYGLVFFALVVAVGVFSEIEEHGGSVFTSGMTAILAAIGSMVLAIGTWVYQTRVSLVATLKAELEPMVARLSENAGTAINVDQVIQHLPSGVIIAIMGALALALIGVNKLLTAFSLPGRRFDVSSSEELTLFRVPDPVLWFAMVAILGAFVKHGRPWLEVISLNALNVLAVLYFFQGLAVIASAFRVFKIGPFWQVLWYFVLVVQLFLMVSLLGFVDFWLEFRERLTRKPAETNKGF